MAEEKPTVTGEIRVKHNPETKAAKRITEDQFKASPSEWLGQAREGQQIIVVENAQTSRVTMVLGVNGVTFELPDSARYDRNTTEANEKQNSWLK